MNTKNKIKKVKTNSTPVTIADNQVEPAIYSTLNLGPTHPATHGIFQNVLKMDGEIVMDSESTIGYIHRSFEKIAENRPYYQFTVVTDRLNYCSAPINNLAWIMSVEKLLEIEIPKRVQYLRVIIMELARISDHIICNSVIGVDTGAMTGFLYIFQMRERIYEIYEELCGARLTTNIGRIGGLERDFSPKVWENLLMRNRIFMDRTVGCGPISAERALNYSFSGPNLRAAGVDYDVRVMNPYCSYEEFDFIIPVGLNGDTYDRFMVREQEMWESVKIIQQAIEKVKKEPEGVYHADVPEYFLPPKEEVYNNMEALIYHFKIVMGETVTPKGEVYHAVEGGNGELGFYIISEGGRAPYRVHIRRPCFIYYQAYAEMIKGGMLSDAILTMSSMNVIAGELDA